MNKPLVGVVVALVLILGVGAFAFSNKSDQTTATSETDVPTSEPKSLKDLLALGVNQKCTFSSDAETSSSGTVYVGSGKVRGDFESQTEGIAVVSHMIVDGSSMYLWMDGEQKGFKASFDSTGENQESSKNSVDPNQKLDYKCESGTVDPSKLILPTDVEFTDMSAYVAIPTGKSPAGDEAKCAACDSLSGSTKTQCLTVLGCN